jgi:hypothetical protein
MEKPISKFQVILRQISHGQTPLDRHTLITEFEIPEGKGFNVVKNDSEGLSMLIADISEQHVDSIPAVEEGI